MDLLISPSQVVIKILRGLRASRDEDIRTKLAKVTYLLSTATIINALSLGLAFAS